MNPRELEQKLEDLYQQGYVNGYANGRAGAERPWLAQLSAFFLGAALGIAIAVAVV